MARGKKSKRFDGRWVIFLILSVMLVLTMILAYFPGLISSPK